MKPISNTALAEKARQQRREPEPGLSHDGQMAADRILLYLRRLHFPESQALELALAAIREAERKTSAGIKTNLVAEAMGELLRLLFENPAAAAHNRLLKGRCEAPGAPQPVIHRLHMAPEELCPTKTVRHGRSARRSCAPAKRAKNGVRVPA